MGTLPNYRITPCRSCSAPFRVNIEYSCMHDMSSHHIQQQQKRQREEDSPGPSSSPNPAKRAPDQNPSPLPGPSGAEMEKLKASIQEAIKTSHVLMYCKSTCPFCTKVRGHSRDGGGPS